MKKLSIVLLSVLLLIVFVGCDLSVETMGKMGNNLAGTDKNYVASIIKQTEPEAAKKKDEDGKITITGSNFSISTDGIKIAEKPVDVPPELQTAINKVLTNSEFSSIILPTDVSDIVLGVKSGSNSETIKKELEKKAEGTSLEAAQGTVLLFNGILDQIIEAQKPVDPEKPVEENGFVKVIDEIKGFLPSSNSITNGDVVVLTALSNIVFNENVLSNVGIIMDEPKRPAIEDKNDPNYKQEEWNQYDKDKKDYSDAMTEVTGEMMNQFSSLLDVVTNVPSGMSNKINDFINDLMDNSDNKEKAE